MAIQQALQIDALPPMIPEPEEVVTCRIFSDHRLVGDGSVG
jgi:hypothetical protein